MAKSFKNQDPRDIVARVLILEDLKTIPCELILQLPEKFHSFVKGKKTASLLGKDGKELTTLEINWEFALFTSTQALLLELFSNFQRVKKEPETTMKKV
jgi:hypothetical protein